MSGYTWQHSDTRGFVVAFPAAISRSIAMQWTPSVPGDAVQGLAITADYRDLLALTLFLCESFSNAGQTPEQKSTGALILKPRGTADFSKDRLPFATALLATIRNLYIPTAKTVLPPGGGGGAPQMLYTAIQTKDGDTWNAIPVSDVAWLAAVLEFAGMVVQAAVVVYCVEKGADIIDRELGRREESARMVSYHAALASLMANHRAAEIAAFGLENAGKPGYQLPMTEVEKSALQALQAAQVAQINAVKKEMPSVFPNMQGTGGAIVSAAKSLGWGALVIGGGLLYLVLKKGS
jgi:hypothetical protein